MSEKKEYIFYADGVSFGIRVMTPEEAESYAKEYQLTYEEII